MGRSRDRTCKESDPVAVSDPYEVVEVALSSGEPVGARQCAGRENFVCLPRTTLVPSVQGYDVEDMPYDIKR